MSDSVNTNPGYLAPGKIVSNGPVDRLSTGKWGFKGTQANAWTDRDISAGNDADGGDDLVFASWATNLTGDQYSNKEHIFMKNTMFGSLTLITPSNADGSSYQPVISRDGTKVAYISDATNIVDGDTNGKADLFVNYLNSGKSVQRVDTTWNGTQGYGSIAYPTFSPDGTKIAFCYTDSSLVGGSDTKTWQVYLKDLATGNITRVSETAGQAAGNGDSASPLAFSPDGKKIAFISDASNLVSGDTNGASDVFVKNLKTGQIDRVSTAANGAQSEGTDRYHSLIFSHDGDTLAFSSAASNLVSGDTNGQMDVFLKNLNTGAIDRVSVDNNDRELNGDSFSPAFSDDDRTLFFATSADIASVGDGNKHIDIFAKDRSTHSLALMSSAPDGTPGNGDSFSWPLLVSSDGNKIYFASQASNLVSNDTNDRNDIFARTIRSTDTARIDDTASHPIAWRYGNLLFTDPDRDNDHKVDVKTSDDNLGHLWADLTNEPNGGYGSVSWRYRILSDELNKLGAGQTKDDTFTVIVDDRHGGTVSHDVTVTIHAPAATSADTTASLHDAHGLTGLEV